MINLNQKNNIQQSLIKISAGDFNLEDVELFIHRIRNITKSDQLLWDFVNFVGHWEGRKEGKSYEHIKPYIEGVIAIIENPEGGTIGGLTPIFNKKDLLKRIINNLRMNGFYINEGRFKENSNGLFIYLIEIIRHVEYKISSRKVLSCFLKQDENNNMKLSVCFQFKSVHSSWVTNPNSPTFCTNFLE